jgi:hypothetical protein
MSHGYDWKKINPQTLMRPSEMLRFFFAIMDDPHPQSVMFARDLLTGEVKYEFMEFTHQYHMHNMRAMDEAIQNGTMDAEEVEDLLNPSADDVEDYQNNADNHMRAKIEAILRRKFDEQKGEQSDD